jgi:hypothetical protein
MPINIRYEENPMIVIVSNPNGGRIQARLVTRQVKTVERTNKGQYGF